MSPVQDAATARPSAASRALPVTPIQQWFFQHHADALNHWNFSVRYTVETGDLDRARSVLHRILRSHDALTTVFEPGPVEGRWGMWPRSTDVPLTVEFLDDIADEARVAERIAYWQRRLDIVSGPVARLVWCESDRPGRAIAAVIAHHLVVDAVSWRMIGWQLLETLGGGEAGTGTDFARWARSHVADIDAGRFEPELEHWIACAERAAQPLFGGTAAWTEAKSRHLVHRSDRLGRRLLVAGRRSPQAATDLVLTAVASACTDLFPELRSLGFDVEIHGRTTSQAGSGGDAVGWFTSFHPLSIEVTGASSVRALRERVGMARESTPGEALGYLALSYGRPEAAAGKLAGISPPPIGINFLGNVDPRPAGDSAEDARLLMDVDVPDQRAATSPRRHPLDLDCAVDGDHMYWRWTYAVDAVPADVIEGLAALASDRLAEVVNDGPENR